MIGALSITGAGIFGAQPALRGQVFSWYDDHDRRQLIIAGVAGCFGIIAIAYLIYRVARLQASVRLSLYTLPNEIRDRLEAHHDTELPQGLTTIAELISKMNETDKRISDLGQKIHAINLKIPDVTPAEGQAYKQVVTIFENTIAQLILVQNSYRAWENVILRDAQDEALRILLLGPSGKRWLVPGAIAAVGITGLVFTLALAKPPDTAPPPAKSELGLLTAGVDTEASRNLWTSLNLKLCEVNGRVPVFVLKTSAQISTVQTIDVNGGCEVKTFSVIPESATLQLPEAPQVEIKYVEVKPTPPNSGTPSPR